MIRAESVDDYLLQAGDSAELLRALRAILLASGLVETVKWGAPCYTLDGKNVVGLAAFASYVGLWFHQGVFLSDPDGVLVNGGEGATKAQRQWRFAAAAELDPERVAAYVREAVENARAGKVVKADRGKPVVVPVELEAALAADPAARAAFAALTPGRQREYTDHVASAKREETRRARALGSLPAILAGVGLNDKYRAC